MLTFRKPHRNGETLLNCRGRRPRRPIFIMPNRLLSVCKHKDVKFCYMVFSSSTASAVPLPRQGKAKE